MLRKFGLGCVASAALAASGVAQAQTPVDIGFITTLSTQAGYLGEDARDGFNLAVTQGGGKLGGVPVNVQVEDDALKPGSAKQGAERMLQAGTKLYTGVIFSNVANAIVPSLLRRGCRACPVYPL